MLFGHFLMYMWFSCIVSWSEGGTENSVTKAKAPYAFLICF